MQKLYIGKETYISLSNAHKALEELRQSGEFDFIIIDAEKSEPSRIVDVLSSSSLFNQSRILFIKRLYRNKKRSEIIEFLLEYLEKEKAEHIILWEDQKVSAITRYVKYFKKNKSLEVYDEINKRAFKTYAKELCQKNNIEVNQNILNILMERSNYNPERLNNNINKLKLLGKKEIVEKDVETSVSNTLENDIWKLLDEMNSPNGNPLTILETILEQGVDPYYILPMVARNIRLIALTKYLQSLNASYSQIASKLKIPPFTVKPLLTASDKYAWREVKKKYEKLCNLDYETKTGRIDPKLGLTLFCTIA